MPKSHKIKLLSKEEVSSQLYCSKFEKPFEFKAGQFAAFIVGDKLKRYYSISSGPDEPELEFLVNTDPGGPGSKFFEKVKVGDEVDIIGPMGNFNFKSRGDAVFIATGTGIAPCISMIKEQLNAGYPRKLHLLFGTRYEKDILKEKDLTELAGKYPNFSFNLSVTRPTEAWLPGDMGNIKKSVGRVTEYLNDIDPKADYYICGIKDMLESVKSALELKGVKKEQIYFEQY
ncbi:FAD-dependent oxidoreductase [Candidatus Dojkabacteria bacterium]|nr:FAD-dependent oxidoreductase [Candidatus Dojkabacteria bacterium]